MAITVFLTKKYCVYYLLQNFVQYVLNYLYSPYSITEESGVSAKIEVKERKKQCQMRSQKIIDI